MRQELDGIIVQLRTIRTAVQKHLRDAEQQENEDMILVSMLGNAAVCLDNGINHLQAASYRAPSNF
jgi:hypothetical protein